VSEFISGVTPLMVFLAIASIGFIFLVISLVVGDLFDSFGVDFDGLDSTDGGHGFLDSRAISVLVSSFGGFGAIGIQMGLGIVASSILGLGGGIVLGGLVTMFARFLYKQQATTSVGTTQMIGKTAQVIVSIAPGSIGQVSCRIGEERIEKMARAKNNQEIKAGQMVRVEEIAGDSLIVSPLSES
jgi:membrane protein implicated in regulation of membrane protease activity